MDLVLEQDKFIYLFNLIVVKLIIKFRVLLVRYNQSDPNINIPIQ